jgi:hypothetical protein
MLAPVAERSVPYPPSWVNRLHARIDALPVATWIVYLVVLLGGVVIGNAVAWVDGYVPAGSFDPYFSQAAFFLVLGYGAVQYLDRVASRAWARFRPLASLDESKAGLVAYELTTLPVWPTRACAVVGIVTAVTYIGFQYGKPFDLAEGPITFTVSLLVLSVVYTGNWTLVYHSLHQLRVIGRAHRYVESIDLLHLERLHAFSGVTAATGVALLALGYASLLVSPDALSNPQVVAWAVLTTVAAIASFVGPLYGIHGLIGAEKSRRLETVNRLLDQALGDLHRRVEQGDLSEADAVNKHISSLLAERDVIARSSTWPWAPETLRGFVTALVLPIALWLVYRILDQTLI